MTEMSRAKLALSIILQLGDIVDENFNQELENEMQGAISLDDRWSALERVLKRWGLRIDEDGNVQRIV